MKKQSDLTVTDDDGKQLECKMLAKIENNNQTYIVYTDNYRNDLGQLRIMASKIKNNNYSNLFPIADEEWEFLEKEMDKIVKTINEEN